MPKSDSRDNEAINWQLLDRTVFLFFFIREAFLKVASCFFAQWVSDV